MSGLHARLPPLRTLGLGATGGALAAALWWRRHPSACPYNQRFWVQAPHPFITRARLLDALDPQPGERMLEIGPGTGYYTLDVAEGLGEEGRLALLDVQREMLDHTLGRARQRGLENLHPTQGDATRLPFDDASFDGAYLVTVLGEIPNQDAALRELRRVLRPSGRLVVGEVGLDPHVVWLGALRKRAQAAGLRYERHVGSRFGYFARFAPA